ncbi:hypothetical protein VCSRO150_3590 [Vibrio cholerae]|nr:hypothetical protein VCSRO150_3590 [Vibrio cholerae]
MLKAFDLNADLPSLAILHKKASHQGGFFVSSVRVEQCDSIFSSHCERYVKFLSILKHL